MKVRVEMQTSPSPGLEFYQGHIECYVPEDATEDDIFREAVRRLRQTAFPERNSRMWTMLGHTQV